MVIMGRVPGQNARGRQALELLLFARSSRGDDKKGAFSATPTDYTVGQLAQGARCQADKKGMLDKVRDIEGRAIKAYRASFAKLERAPQSSDARIIAKKQKIQMPERIKKIRPKIRALARARDSVRKSCPAQRLAGQHVGG